MAYLEMQAGVQSEPEVVDGVIRVIDSLTVADGIVEQHGEGCWWRPCG